MVETARFRAVLCRELGAPASLTLEHLPRPSLAPGQIRIRLRAGGVNFPDLLMVAGKYQHKPPLPFTPGLEGAGVVIETAPDVEVIGVGDEVVVWHCLGTYADEIVVSGAQVVPKPRELSFEQAASF